MAGGYCTDSLLSFLKEVVVAGHMPSTTARSRSQAARALMAYLTDGERSDLRVLDMEALRARLAEDQSGVLRPEVADLYIERLECALEDFLPFAEAAGGLAAGATGDTPTDRQIGLGQRPEERPGDRPEDRPERRPEQRPEQQPEQRSKERPEDRRALESARLRFDRNRSDIVPIPLPRGSTVYVHGLPADLSPAEARKIARVLAALADGEDTES